MKVDTASLLPRSSTSVGPRFAQAINLGDLDGAASCFARDGCLITPDATAVHGREHIRGVLAQLVRRRTEIRIELTSSVSAGHVVLVHQRWRIRTGERPNQHFEQITDAVLVLRQIEDEWKLSIAAPWGYGRAYG